MSQNKDQDNTPKINWVQKARRVGRFLADNTSLPEILFISTFILIRWWNNSDFSYPSEIVIPIVLFSVMVTAVFYIYRFIIGPGLATHAAALSLSYLFYIFQFVENSRLGKFVYDAIPGGLSTAFFRSLVLALMLGVLCGLLAWVASKLLNRVKFLQHLQLHKVLLFAIVFIFALQLFRTAGRLYEIRSQLSYKPVAPALTSPLNQPAQVKPDIYYLVFDRYTSPEVLKENFNYDNSEIVDFLNNQGFVTRQNAYSNYPFTMSSIASTLSMNYFPQLEKQFGRDGRWQSAAPYRALLNNPPIAKLLSEYGYRFNQVSSWWDFTRVGINADNDPTKSYRLRVFNRSFYFSDLQRDIMFKSILSPWLKKGATIGNTAVLKYDLDRNPSENLNVQLASLKGIAARKDKSNPQFTFAHILAPHPPYVFDENGKSPAYDNESNDNGVDESVKYTTELTYINKRLKELISSIKRNSPSSIIVLQADEGPYPKQFRGPMSADRYYDPIELPQKQMRQKFGILASYYMPGLAPEEVQTMNASVNLFRFILNKYFGYGLEMLPDCQLSTGNKFNLYNYTAVNDRLSGGPLPSECRQYE
ncbi:MAG TPA: sulfatase-like hydrolase/transferase [Candidatus Saccharimonadales bacterium]